MMNNNQFINTKNAQEAGDNDEENLLEQAAGLSQSMPDQMAEAIEVIPESAVQLVPLSGGKPAQLPEKFWDEKSQSVRLGAMIESYLHLERKLSSGMPEPKTPEDKMKLMKLLGMPDSADQYDVDVSHGLFDVDSDLNEKMFEKGFTLEQVQSVYDLAAEKFVPLVLEIAQEFQADREVERLVAAFGSKEKWQEVSRQLLAFGQQSLPAEVLESLSSSFEGVMALYRMMKGNEPGLEMNGSQGNGAVAPVDEDGLRNMMRDPKYWRDRDPGFVKKVTKGFEAMYGGK